jgi:hypothetical protein
MHYFNWHVLRQRIELTVQLNASPTAIIQEANRISTTLFKIGRDIAM